jgi:hypothetical protein
MAVHTVSHASAPVHTTPVQTNKAPAQNNTPKPEHTVPKSETTGKHVNVKA